LLTQLDKIKNSYKSNFKSDYSSHGVAAAFRLNFAHEINDQ